MRLGLLRTRFLHDSCNSLCLEERILVFLEHSADLVHTFVHFSTLLLVPVLRNVESTVDANPRE